MSMSQITIFEEYKHRKCMHISNNHCKMEINSIYLSIYPKNEGGQPSLSTGGRAYRPLLSTRGGKPPLSS